MAGLQFSVGTEGFITYGPPSPAGDKTLLQIIAASNRRVVIHEISITFQDSDTNGGEAQIIFARQTTAGASLSSVTPKKLNPSDGETLQVTAQKGIDGTTGWTEPTKGDILLNKAAPLAGGEFHWVALREEERIVIPGVTSPSVLNRVGIILNHGSNLKAQVFALGEE